MKIIKFRDYLVEPILIGTKTSTWRLFDDKALSKGDEIELQVFGSNEKFAEAVITNVDEKPLRELSEADKEGHETFASNEEMYKTYSRYYQRTVTPETSVKIIRFKLRR
jgi:hypothetical protein